MTEKFNITGFLRSLVLPHPARDWLIALSLLILIFLGLLAYGGYLFWGVYNGTIVSGTESGTLAPKITRADMTSTLEAYRARRAKFEARDFGLPELPNPAR